MRLLFILLITLLSCSRADEMSIIVYDDCPDVETVADLLRSIDNNKAKFEQSSIVVLNDSDESKCGYLLRREAKEKFIEGAMTDIDLLMEAERFFQISIISND